jgi:hypothetical protein
MWTFEIVSGKLFDSTGAYTAQGYAGGDLGKDPAAKFAHQESRSPR